jgi:hypothetical protein
MKTKDSALVWVKTASFTGWRCHACGWARPYRRLLDPDKRSKADARIAFDLHKCDLAAPIAASGGR